MPRYSSTIYIGLFHAPMPRGPRILLFRFLPYMPLLTKYKANITPKVVIITGKYFDFGAASSSSCEYSRPCLLSLLVRTVSHN